MHAQSLSLAAQICCALCREVHDAQVHLAGGALQHVSLRRWGSGKWSCSAAGVVDWMAAMAYPCHRSNYLPTLVASWMLNSHCAAVWAAAR